MIKVGSDFSGVGAFDQALRGLNIDYKTVFACDMDKYARETYIHNYGVPTYYPENVYDRLIPKVSLDIYMTSPPCQAFSLAGNRKGEGEKRGVLFYNSHEFILKNNPRYFIFENVKGLLSDDGGKTFQRWCDMLGGKSINGNPVIFPMEDSAPYHVYHKVLNAKKFGIPQNRERVFIIGIRDDADNTFRFPKEEPLLMRLKDILQKDIKEKYFLSEKAIEGIKNSPFNSKSTIVQDKEGACATLLARDYKDPKCVTVNDEDYTDLTKYFLSDKMIKGFLSHKERHEEKGAGFKWQPKTEEDTANTIRVKSAVKKGYETAVVGDSIRTSHPNSETRRGRVGNQVAQTLDTASNQVVVVGAIRGRDKKEGQTHVQKLEINKEGVTNTITSVQKDNVVIVHNLHGGFGETEPRIFEDYSPTIRTSAGGGYIPSVLRDSKIRRLTPRECFRLMDFPDTFTWTVSDTQAYKQAGNSIVRKVLMEIIKNLNL